MHNTPSPEEGTAMLLEYEKCFQELQEMMNVLEGKISPILLANGPEEKQQDEAKGSRVLQELEYLRRRVSGLVARVSI